MQVSPEMRHLPSNDGQFQPFRLTLITSLPIAAPTGTALRFSGAFCLGLAGVFPAREQNAAN
jgi:hypothetical protein